MRDGGGGRGAPFDPRRLDDRRRPEDVVGRMVDPDAGRRALGMTEIRIFGVGGAGNNAISRMVSVGLSGAEFIAVNCDAQHLALCPAGTRLVIGERVTRRLGAGGDPALGERAAQESVDEIEAAVAKADMVFITAGMGGGTGTGASPVIAQLAKQAGALTVAVVTTPFAFEGARRRQNARTGIENLRGRVDALIVINNDRLLKLIDKRTTISDAFFHADGMLMRGVRGIADLITNVGLVNVDFADVRSVMLGAGTALLGVGAAAGEDRAKLALAEAMDSPLLDIPIEGASGILVNVTGGEDLGIHEVEAVVEGVRAVARSDAKIVFGAMVDPRPVQTLTVTVIATGFSKAESKPPWELRTGEARARRPVATRAAEQQTASSAFKQQSAPTERQQRPPAAPAPRPVLHEIDDRPYADLSDEEVPAFVRRRQRPVQ